MALFLCLENNQVYNHNSLCYREIVEVSIAPKPQKLSAADHAQLTDLLLAKDAELKKTLELADEQAKIQQKMNELKAEVENKVGKQKNLMLLSSPAMRQRYLQLLFCLD